MAAVECRIPCQRPGLSGGPIGNPSAGGARDFKIQQRRLLKLGGLSNDSLMDRWVTRHVSRYFTRVLIVTPITPKQITWHHMFMGLGAAWYLYQGNHTADLVGGVLLLVSAWLDSTDGEVARLRFQESRFGGMFDIIADNIVHFAVFFAIGMGQVQATGQVMYQYMGEGDGVGFPDVFFVDAVGDF